MCDVEHRGLRRFSLPGNMDVLLLCSILTSMILVAEGDQSVTGCANLPGYADTLLNRVTKKAGLEDIDRLIASAGTASTDEECARLTFPGVNINFETFDRIGELVARNGRVVSDSYSSLTFPFHSQFSALFSNSLVDSDCSRGPNPFHGGFPIFNSLTYGTITAYSQIFGAGGCLGGQFSNGTRAMQPLCQYRYKYNATTLDLTYSNPAITGEAWFISAKKAVASINEHLGNLSNLKFNVRRQLGSLGARNNILVTSIAYDRSFWTNPYFDCYFGKIWMVTYSAPVHFVHENGTLEFIGMTAIDVNLSDVDVNECNLDSSTTSSAFNSFRNTHLCEPVSTQCTPKAGEGFRFGSYNCFCRPGFYRRAADGSALPKADQFFPGTTIENVTAVQRRKSKCNCTAAAECIQETERIRAILEKEFTCRRCPKLCETCVTGDEVCVVQLSAGLVVTLTTMNVIAVVMALVLIGLVIKYRETRVIRSASWPFLVIMLVGAIMALSGTSLSAFAGGYSSIDNTETVCTVWPWLNYLGFTLTYGSILVKTWRLHQIFSTRRFRGKGRKNLTNGDLGWVLSGLVLLFTILLLFWTIGLPSRPVISETRRGLKYTRCSVSFIDDITAAITLLFLLPVVYLSFQLRNVTDDFSESKEINVSAYIFLVVKVVTIVASHSFNFTPDLFYLLRVLDVQFSFTLSLAIFFYRKISKVLAGKANEQSGNGFILNKKKRTAINQPPVAMCLDQQHRCPSSNSFESHPTSLSVRKSGDALVTSSYLSSVDEVGMSSNSLQIGTQGERRSAAPPASAANDALNSQHKVGNLSGTTMDSTVDHPQSTVEH